MSVPPPTDPGGAGGAGESDRQDFYGAERRPAGIRGFAVVVGAVVLCLLLLPYTTRNSSAATSTTSSTGPTTTTTAAHSAGRTTTTTTHSSHGGATTTTAPAPATVHVLVANGTTANGVAGGVTTFLGQKGFGTLTAANSLTRVQSTQIYPTGGSVAAAQEVATALGLPASTVQAVGAPAPVSSASGATVVVIAGPELASRFAPSAQG
ncbi:MAG TPA: LytR C-terminal domain-containing protein [Acidimicrobiales bacterium]|nr:LytR C-terminal domain-containing protein [Acidimicrobiales bacterium]